MGAVLLLRHAESTWNAVGRMQGWADAPLSPAGAAHAAALGRRLAETAPGEAAPGAVAGLVSSDLRRATATAAALAAAVGCPAPAVDARLREREIGWLTGLTNDEARTRFGSELIAWREQHRPRPPGGESSESVARRARRALDAATGWARELGQGIVVAVSHGGLISVLEREAGLGPGGFANLSGRWVLPGADGGWRLGERFG